MAATTPSRQTHIVVDFPRQTVTEPLIAAQRAAFEIARSPSANTENLWNPPFGGWRLEPLQRRAALLQESTALQGSILGAGSLQVPSGWIALNAFRQKTELAGVTYAASVPPTADPFFQKQVASNTSWDASEYSLTTDQASFPSPTLGNENVPMDRVAVSSPITPDQEFFLRIACPGTAKNAPDRIANLTFPGPAGATGANGNGMYSLSLRGDGFAELYEQQSPNFTWRLVQALQYCSPHLAIGPTHLIHILPLPTVAEPELLGALVIEVIAAETASPRAANNGGYRKTNPQVRQVAVPIVNSGFTPNPNPTAPIRLDIRRDLRPAFQLSMAAYAPSATLIDDAFSLPFSPSNALPITFAWFTLGPHASLLTGTLLDESTGNPLTQTGSIAGFPQFTPTFPARTYRPKFTFTGDGPTTPSLFGHRLQRDAILTPETLTETDLAPSATEVRLIGNSDDPTHASAFIKIDDLNGTITALNGKPEPGLKVTTSYDATNPASQAVLFVGDVVRTEASIRGPGRIPGGLRQTFTLHAAGMWRRLMETPTPIRFDFSKDFNNTDALGRWLPFRVTDALTTLFAVAGFGGDAVQIPDLPLLLFSTGAEEGLIVEPNTPVGDVITRWASDYLGLSVLFEPNLGNAGAWILASMPSSASTLLATFLALPATTTQPPNTPGAGNIIRKGSYTAWTVPPAASGVVALGLAPTGEGHFAPTLLKQVLVNPNCFSYAGSNPDPNSADYLGRWKPLVQFLPGHTTAEAVGWVARRLYDLHCHGKRRCRFQAPLVLVADAALSTLRPLRTFDPVTVNGVPSWIRSVSPQFRHDDHQFAFYEAEAF